MPPLSFSLPFALKRKIYFLFRLKTKSPFVSSFKIGGSVGDAKTPPVRGGVLNSVSVPHCHFAEAVIFSMAERKSANTSSRLISLSTS